ncbi:pyridoxamine 5'-phosphate oxidase family protein [Allorhodopirellula solitaria]|uniref:Pyridoxamine 5'-phosphate oxidase n=1 Tax=Allorhodopirellula solitaria TaxID=2527987 RepID=A0A5C5YC42_9BACT|nr:pyridoxamine 5'-phosphate oxidase family protein [Allorhodopirellula solitaria]TWT73287.1 Pyridoxamine 5'-phosphate oxidase [Allorhodopirellula solitaria]
MSNTDLSNQDAVAKLKELAESIDFAMLCTDMAAKPFHAIPMSTKKVDADGRIWFLSGRDSTHNDNIRRDNQVEVLYSDPSSMRFLNVYGKAEIRRDREILKELYGSADDSWFDGLDDPNLSAIEIAPLQAHYWDVKGNRLVALLKMGWGGVTGSEPDLAQHGDLKM